MQSNLIKIPEAVTIFQDAIGRIESMGLLYDKLYKSENYQDVSVKAYLSVLIDEIIEIFPQNKNIEIKKNIEDFNIPSKILFPLGIIVNELLTNTIKYAFHDKEKGIIQIEITKEDNCVFIIFKDNGIGMPEPGENMPGHFGLSLIKLLVEQINGSYRFENDDGLKFSLEFDF